MKILNVGGKYFVGGGSDTYLLNLEKLLSTHGHEVIPFVPKHSKNLPTEYDHFFPEPVYEDGKFPISKIHKAFYNTDAARMLEKLIDREKPDMAHLHIYYGNLTTSILDVLNKKGIPVVQTLHEYKTICPVYTLHRESQICTACQGSKFYKAALNRCKENSLIKSAMLTLQSYVARWTGDISKVDHFIAVSDFQRDLITSFGTIPTGKIDTVHNFIDAAPYHPDYEPGDYFLYFGRIDLTKGIEVLLKAFRELPSICLKVVGEGPYLTRAQEFASANKMENVEFLGFKGGNDLTELIANSYVTIVPSQWYETFGLTTIESFALGKPVIGSNIGGITEVITDNEDGLLFDYTRISSLVEKVKFLKSHEQEVIRMGQNGRKKVETVFSAERHYHHLMGVYDKVL